MWDEKFNTQDFLYGQEPNAFIASQAYRLPQNAHVLCLAEGEGRNAIHLAKANHTVTALDASQVGLDKAMVHAQTHDVEISCVCTDLWHWYATKEYDAIVASFMHLPHDLRLHTFGEVKKALKKGGVFIMEAFSKNQRLQNFSSGGPKDISLLYDVQELADIFDDETFEMLYLKEEVDTLSEGTGHQGKASLVRLVVQKR